jgi:hypothetical protein
MTAKAKILDLGHRLLRHRKPWKVYLVVLGLSLTSSTLAGPATATGRTICSPKAGDALLGSWYAQVHFPGQPFPGLTESTLMTFTPGGGLVEANGVNPSPAGNSGFWALNPDCSYSARTVLFDWDKSNSAIKTVTDVRLRLVVTDKNHFRSTSADATVSIFDPQTGQRVGDQIVIADISQTTAERLTVWAVPQSFPAAP